MAAGGGTRPASCRRKSVERSRGLELIRLIIEVPWGARGPLGVLSKAQTRATRSSRAKSGLNLWRGDWSGTAWRRECRPTGRRILAGLVPGQADLRRSGESYGFEE